jgi:AP-4 complex subunit beta-1
MATPYPASVAPHGQQPGTATAVNPVPDSYFTESRKGEISELRNLLRGFGTERDVHRKRDIIKKVIAYMTLGIDVSRLFTEMMLAIETRCVDCVLCVYCHVVLRTFFSLLFWCRIDLGAAGAL